MNRHDNLKFHEIVTLLKGHVDDVVKTIFPAAVKHGGGWQIGSLYGEKGASLSISTKSGNTCGHWQEFNGENRGDILDLVAKARFNGSKPDAIQWAKSFLGLSDIDPPKMRKMIAAAKEASKIADENAEAYKLKRVGQALGFYTRAEKLAGTLGERYLTDRMIERPAKGWTGSLKFHPQMYHVETKQKHPCLIAYVVDGFGNFKTIHRIFLQQHANGRVTKLQNVKSAKMIYSSFAGGFVPICKGISKKSMVHMGEDEKLMICEGIEDALILATAKPDYRIIASISLGNIGAIAKFLPPSCRHVTLFKDNDTNVAAIRGFERARDAHLIAGRQVVVSSPPLDFKDVNDWWIDMKSLGTGKN